MKEKLKTAAVLVSGGLDSAILAVDLLGEYSRVRPIYVRFGLRWEPGELAGLRSFLEHVGKGRPGLLPLAVLDDPVEALYGEHWSLGRGPLPGVDAPDDAVYLPGRNVLLLSRAAVYCQVRGIEAMALGVLAGNPFPDASPGFFEAMAATLGNGLGARLQILRPYEHLTKAEVLRRGSDLPLGLTVSCLGPVGGRHCGSCNKCGERRRGFEAAGIADPTDYLNNPT